MATNGNAPITPVSDLSQMAQVDIYVGNSMQLKPGYTRVTDPKDELSGLWGR